MSKEQTEEKEGREQGAGSKKNRRAFPRFSARYPVFLEVELGGEPLAMERFDTDGETVNLSRGGMLARVFRRIAVGSSCQVYFFQATGRIQPQFVAGTVRRAEEAGAGWRIGVEFESPLEVLAIPAAAEAG